MRLGVEAALVDGRLVPGDVALDDGVVSAVGLDDARTALVIEVWTAGGGVREIRRA